MPAKVIEYLDFDLQISRTESGLRALVLNSPSGVASVDFVLPFSATEIENFLLRMGQGRRGMRRRESSQMAQAKIFGGQLFEAVFQNDVLSCYRSSLNEALGKNAGLRIRLRLSDAPDLIDLPWEYLYNPSANHFISLSANTPLIRFLDLPGSVRPLAIKLPLHMLVMISSPSDYEQMDVEREWQNLNYSLSDLAERNLVVVDRCEPTLAGLQKQLRIRNYHIFHFIGHGGFDTNQDEGVLVLEDEAGKSREISGQYLGMLLHDERTLSLAVINACEGGRTSQRDYFAGVGQSLLQQSIPAVIAMQFQISDPAAITLSREFYTTLADGYGVDAALSEARKSILANNNDIEWGTPVLYTSMPNGQIFDIKVTQYVTDDTTPTTTSTANTLISDVKESPVSTPLLDQKGWHLRRIEQLARAGHDAMMAKEWDEAIDKLTSLVELEPSYQAAQDSLEEAKAQHTLTKLYVTVNERIRRATWVWTFVSSLGLVATLFYAGPAEDFRLNFPNPAIVSVCVVGFTLALLSIVLQLNRKTKLFSARNRVVEFLYSFVLYLFTFFLTAFLLTALVAMSLGFIPPMPSPWGHIYLWISIFSGFIGAGVTGLRLKLMYKPAFQYKHMLVLVVFWPLIALVLWFTSALIPTTPAHWRIVTFNWYDTNFANLDLDGANLDYSDLAGTTLSGATLNRVSLKSAELRNADLSGIEGSSINFDYARFYETDLSKASLNYVDFSQSYINKINFADADLWNASFGNQDLGASDFSGANIMGVDFEFADLTGANFSLARYDAATEWPENFEYMTIGALGPNAQLAEVNLQEMLLPSFELSNANMINANLAYTQLGDYGGWRFLNYGNFSGLFRGTNLSWANLSNATIQRVDFRDAILANADFSNAEITDSDFSGADLTDVILTDATYNDETIWPEGFNPEEVGAITFED